MLWAELRPPKGSPQHVTVFEDGALKGLIKVRWGP
jgi:hypothetical protein